MQNTQSEANKLKSLAGKDLKESLVNIFTNLKHENIIANYSIDQNFSHKGFEYEKQYLANFIIETLDNKFIIINSSTSYRHDRAKLQSYDINGITSNASISDKIIASILLYPDPQLDNSSLKKFRENVISKKAYSPASHIFVISELINFLNNHRDAVEEERVRLDFETSEHFKNGSYYGLRGNAFEKEVVAELNNLNFLQQIIKTGSSKSEVFTMIILKLCNDYSIPLNELTGITATNTILKLRGGGNAKTDIVLTLKTYDKIITETISVKNTTQNRVSCHDYTSDDFIRVLGIKESQLANYFHLYQKCGSHELFLEKMPPNYSLKEFINLLNPHKTTLLEWALQGSHDYQNLINPEIQTSNYLLINKSGSLRFIDFKSYIQELYKSGVKLLYGLPLSWTYPSKKRGERIQLKVPVII